VIAGLTQLLLFQLVGEVIARGLDLPVPGPVLGMFFLFVALVLRGEAGAHLEGASQGLLRHLSLLFVPVGTGIMVHMHRVADEWLPITLSLVLSTAATLAVTGLVMKLLADRHAADIARGEP
jgi:holin-like protein